MSIGRTLSGFLLRILPKPIKRGLRAIAPNALYRMFVRATRGMSLFGPDPDAISQARFGNSRAQALESKLWGGFSRYAVSDLEALRESPLTPPGESTAAALILARYYAANEDHERVLAHLASVRAANPSLGRQKRARLVAVHSLLALGRTDDARHLLDLTLSHGDAGDGCTCAAMASSYLVDANEGRIPRETAIQEWLNWMNRPLELAGFAGVTLRNPEKDLNLGNLQAAGSIPTPQEMPAKVSVLMAAFNATDNLETAVRSILEQTWSNLELVIADDASTDNTWDMIQAFMKEDERVKGIRMPVNGGAYVARNAALETATGDFVVVNDADDWAHPQKIETQIRHLLADDAPISNMTFRVRISPDMIAQARLDSPHVPIIHNDYSALMLKREKVLEMGGWDSVRFSADAEFVERLRVVEGQGVMEKIHGNVPLSFSLFDGNNLTASSATSIWTNRFGSRHEYIKQFRSWHRSGKPLKVKRESQTSPYPVPGISYMGPGSRQQYDIVLASDFRLPGGTTHCNIEYLKAFRELGLSVAILPWDRYEIHYTHAANPKITEICRKHGVVPLSHGDNIDCDLLLIHHPPVAMHELDRFPSLNTQQVAILANQSAQRLYSGPNDMYSPEAVQTTVQRLFGKKPIWIPISGIIRRLLEEDPADTQLSTMDWTPLIRSAGMTRNPVWKGDERITPVVGRHCRDQWIKWPASADAIRQAYLADESCTVKLMGGADTAIQALERQPGNWQLIPFDSIPVDQFLEELDIFLHYIHEDAIEAFGRNVAEAMAAGLPVICSPNLSNTFGSAAIYGEPHEIPALVDKLWKDRDYYLKVARAGQRFVEAQCSSSQINSRLVSLKNDTIRIQEMAASTS